MLNQLLDLLAQSPAFQRVLAACEQKQTAALYDLCEGQRAALACAYCAKTGKKGLLIAPNESSALRIYEDCQSWLNGRAAYLPPENLVFTRGAGGREADYRRMESLTRVLSGKACLLVCTIEALQTRLPDPGQVLAHTQTLKRGQVCDREGLLRALVRAGYEHVSLTEGAGQCAMRGEIIDVFPPDAPNPFRIEFFDTEIDTIRAFDPMTQRSAEGLEEAVIHPAQPFLYGEEECREAADALRQMATDQLNRLPREMLEYAPLPDEDEPSHAYVQGASGVRRMLDDADTLQQGMPLENARLFAGVLTPYRVKLSDWLGDFCVFVDTPENVRGRAQDRREGFLEEFKLALERRECIPAQQCLVMDFDEVWAGFDGAPAVLLQDFLRGMSGIVPDVTLPFPGKNAEKYLGRVPELVRDVRALADGGFRILLLSGGQARATRLQTALREQKLLLPIGSGGDALLPGAPIIFPATLSRGFVCEEMKLALLSDTDLFGAGYKKARKTRTSSEKIDAFTDLKEGDPVVHEHHGVGIFRGTVRLQTEGTWRDYVLIQYRGSDKLYVPADQFDRVQKYIGSADSMPPLNSLGGGDWEKQKKRVKAGLKKLAFDLVKLYADRKSTPGHAFAPDTIWQRQFEDAFPYELTPDQTQAVQDITRDMEQPVNMDRLLCGDVGYGKTEVALRAAFKAVQDSKQVALLAPTTILAQQHYETLVRRLGEFPVNVDVLSRFKSPAAQKDTLRKLALGQIDILVGTHRILGKDVQFKDLGLLIVDEEQRFGVQHKETIKRMKTSVDVLTLSATPIPRTLHMSMVGVRDMSLLETPPEERLPVQTYVIDYSDAVVRDAIRRELNRQGQVYFLYNRVRSIDQFAARLRTLVPEARIGVGHGQMKEQALEDLMRDFYEGNIDVLLSTTIIENGLDVPKANTLIVFDADRFGLSQLYQLRGRVGRSNRSAYAYFTVRPDKMLTEDAQKRLSAIREFTEFGSGFRIAMRDLEIRGAGNIFGPEQSGNISGVGYDMYVRLIEEAVREAQCAEGKTPAPAVLADTRVDLKVDAFLPADYVQGEVQRMEVYKRISSVHDRAGREDVIEELIDRFGDVPGSVLRLIDIAHLRGIVSQLGVTRVTHHTGVMTFTLDGVLMPDVQKLLSAMEETDKRLVLSASRTPAILLRDARADCEKMLIGAVPVMEKLLKKLEKN